MCIAYILSFSMASGGSSSGRKAPILSSWRLKEKTKQNNDRKSFVKNHLHVPLDYDPWPNGTVHHTLPSTNQPTNQPQRIPKPAAATRTSPDGDFHNRVRSLACRKQRSSLRPATCIPNQGQYRGVIYVGLEKNAKWNQKHFFSLHHQPSRSESKKVFLISHISTLKKKERELAFQESTGKSLKKKKREEAKGRGGSKVAGLWEGKKYCSKSVSQSVGQKENRPNAHLLIIVVVVVVTFFISFLVLVLVPHASSGSRVLVSSAAAAASSEQGKEKR